MRTKEVRYNKTMRAGVILLVVALITLIALVVTFAKYASQGTGEDSARIARWGVNSSIPTGLDLFDGRYTGPDGKTITVDSSDGANVVAPGTSKMQTINLASFTGNQAPEVMYHFEPTLKIVDQSTTSTQTISMLEKLNQNKAFTWRLVDTNGIEQSYQTYQELQNAVAAMGEPDIAPNHFPTNFGGTATPQIKIGWAWSFEYNDTANDQSDTEMGNLSGNDTLTGLNTTLTLNAYQCQGRTTPTEKVTLKGTVSSNEGKTPVQGASVAYMTSSSNGTTTTTTDENGEYKMQVPKNSTGIIEFTKDGYESQKQEIGPLTSDTEVTIKNFEPKETTYTVTFESSPKDAGVVLDDDENQVTEVSGLAKSSEIYVDAESKKLVIVDLETRAATKYHTNDATGYIFKEWQGIPDSGTITDNITVTAAFETQASYSVMIFTEYTTLDPIVGIVMDVTSYYVNDDNSLSISKSDGKTETIKATANSGYTFKGWYNDGGTKIEPGITVPLSEDETLMAKSAKSGYISSLKADENTTLNTYDSVNNSKSYSVYDNKLYIYDYEGNEHVITATASDGFTFNAWYINDQEIKSGTYATLEDNATFKATSEKSVDYKPIQYKIDGIEDPVNFLPAFEENSAPANFYALEDGKYIELNNTSMEELYKEIDSHGVENIYTDAKSTADQSVTFYGTIDRSWNDTFNSPDSYPDTAKGLTDSMKTLLKNGGSEYAYKTVYFNDNDDTKVPEEACGNWNHTDDSEPQLGSVGYNLFYNAYTTSLLCHNAKYPWSSRASGDSYAYLWQVDQSYWDNPSRTYDSAVILSKDF